MIKKAIGAVAALTLFVAGTMLITGYVRSSEDRRAAEVQPTAVMVASQPIEAGTSPHGSLRVEEYPLRLVSDDMVVPGDSLNGLVATVDLVAGEPILWSRVDEPTELETGERTRAPIPQGMTAVTVPVAPERTFGGLLLPGMHVAVIGSFELRGDDAAVKTTHALVQQALVVEVQAEDPFLGDGEEADLAAQLVAAQLPTGGYFVTLAMPIYDVERVVFAAEWGTIWLAEQGEHVDTRGARVQTGLTIFNQVDPESEPPRWPEEVLGISPELLAFVASQESQQQPAEEEPVGLLDSSNGDSQSSPIVDSEGEGS